MTVISPPLVLPTSPPSLSERIAIFTACQASEEARQQAYERSGADAKWFINAFGYTFDPRPTAPHPHLPFILYPFQEDMVDWLDDRVTNLEDGLIDKSREMGVTWTFVAWVVHGWLFKPGFTALLGSRKEQYVDDKSMKSLFGMMTYFINNLPGWLKPKGFNPKKHRVSLKIVNPENGNEILGESSNPNFARGGRYSVVFFDEGAFWKDMEEAWRSAGDATRTRIGVSTPSGMNAWGRMIHSNMYPHLRLHWTLHPLKDESWYEYEKARRSPEDLAQEVDISYNRSVSGLIYPIIHDIPKGEYWWEQGYSVYVSWDFGFSDDTVLIWWARNPLTGKSRMIDSFALNQKTIDYYVPFALGYIPDDIRHDYSPAEMQKISEHTLLPKAIHFGDPDVTKRNLVSGTSARDVLAKYGIHIVSNPSARSFKDRKVATELGLKELEGIDIERCAPVIEALENARYRKSTAVSKATPVDDHTSHYRTAVEYYFVNVPAGPLYKRPDPYKREMAYDRI